MTRHPLKGSAPAWYRLGSMQLQQGQLRKAADSFRQALAKEPTMAHAWHNLAHATQRMWQYDEALVCYHRALQYCPDDPCSLNNLGVLLREMGRLDESLQVLRQLTSRYPDDGDGHWNHALSLLTDGNYPDGWQEYEWRFRRTRPVQVTDPGTPRWQGEPLEGKTILLCCEQAYGDNIQFIRFAATLADWGATVLLLCPDHSLADLLANAPGVSKTCINGEALPEHDCWSPLLSLPLRLQTHQDNVPACPYLFANAATKQNTGSDRPKIGLVWSGRSTDPHRACPVQLFAPLARFAGQVSFYSLQLNSPGDNLHQLQALLGIIDLAPQLSDFNATASLMQELDLIISIDSAPAHLAGALGRECWLMLHHAPDWRWGRQPGSSCWYPTIRQFRQPAPGAWQPVIDQLVTALEDWISKPGSGTPVATANDLMALADQRRAAEQWSAACHLYQRAGQLDTNSYSAQICAGGCLLFLNRPAEATALFRQAISIQPDQPEAHINLGLALLCSDNLTEGLQEFEWRRHAITQPLPPIPELPAIQHDTRLNGRTVLIHTEQGLGDQLQFARYLPLLAETGARIVITVPHAMVRLMASVRGVSQVIPYGALLPAADYQLPLLSLPLRMLGTLPGIPSADSAYIAPEPALRKAWQKKLTSDHQYKVGIVWQGSELGKSGYRRALTPELLTPLFELSGVSFYSLQIGATVEQLAVLPGIIDLAPLITDFADTAAIMTNLDLVISIDTSTAHLAGALGVRCWVPLLFAPDWRWYPLQEPYSRWYSSLMTFRQPAPGQWEPVVSKLCISLQGEALLHQGHTLGKTGNRAAAIAIFREAAELSGYNGPALLNLGIYLRAEGNAYEAREALRKATEAAPDYPEAWQNLGLAHQDLGELPEAYTCLKRAMALRPDYATAHWNLGLLQLLLGEYQAGFKNAEFRFSKIGAVPRQHIDIPSWDGSSLAGKTILIHAEQGYGDTIQFVRYLPLLAEAGAQVILEVQDRSLLELCRTVQGPSQVIVRGDSPPAVDLQTPLLSLPYLVRSTFETIPRKVPYLSADKEKIAAWQQRLPNDYRRTVGICWKGRTTPDPRRSIPFMELEPLFKLPDIHWVCLQFDHDESAQLPGDMLDPSSEIHDFAGTAALMSCLDLIISIDSAVAHLAGALGIPGFVLLPFAPDWRWGVKETTAPWYPSLELLRQQRPGQWRQAVTELAVRLNGIFTAEGGQP